MSTQVSKVLQEDVALAVLLNMNREVSGCQQACLHFHKYLKKPVITSLACKWQKSVFI